MALYPLVLHLPVLRFARAGADAKDFESTERGALICRLRAHRLRDHRLRDRRLRDRDFRASAKESCRQLMAWTLRLIP